MSVQVVHAAQTFVVQPKSSVLQKNMAIFREGWVENVTLLTNSVDALTPLLDFLIVTGEGGGGRAGWKGRREGGKGRRGER